MTNTGGTVLPPRMVPRGTRYLAGAGGLLVTIVVAALASYSLGTDSLGAHFLVGLLVCIPFVPSLLVLLNSGFRPRPNGRYVDASTVFGRQSVDLAALAKVAYFPGSVKDGLRIADGVNDLNLWMPAAGTPVHAALGAALFEAGRRGVPVPRAATARFGLPEVPGAPRNGKSGMTGRILLAIVALMLGLAIGLGARGAGVGG